MRSMGVDLSTKATGLVVLEDAEGKPKLIFEESLSFPKLSGFYLYREIVTRIVELVDQFEPDRLVIEGYSLNMKNASSVVPLVELGGLLRFMLHVDGRAWLDPRATELKKFVIGKGNGSKDQVMMWVLHRWGHMSKDNNTADAFGLACMGLAHANRLFDLTKEMRLVAGAMSYRQG